MNFKINEQINDMITLLNNNNNNNNNNENNNNTFAGISNPIYQ